MADETETTEAALRRIAGECVAVTAERDEAVREVRQLRQALDKIRTLCSKAGATPLSVGVVGVVHLRPILAAAAAAQQPKCEHDRSGPHAIHGFGPIAQVLAGVDDRCPGPVTSTPEAATCNRPLPHESHSWGHPGDLKLCPGVSELQRATEQQS